MTRDEANKIAHKEWIKECDCSESIVNILIDFGILKLDEPKSATFTKLDAVQFCRSAYLNNSDFVAGMENFGWRIVEK